MKTDISFKTIFAFLTLLLNFQLSLSDCPIGSISNLQNCTTCLSLNKTYFKSDCIANCPDGRYADSEGICQEMTYTGNIKTKLVFSCEFSQDSCQNDGKCNFRFHFIHCDCKPDNIGIYCQLDLRRIQLSEYISKYC
jgi:hypothetical protein